MKPCLLLIALLGLASGANAQTAWEDQSSSWIRHTIDASSQGADGVKVMDANGDGQLDIVTGWEEGGVVQVYLHPGVDRVTSLWPRVVVGRVPHVEDAVFIDRQGAGRYDVVSAAEGDERTLFYHKAPQKPDLYLEPTAWQTHSIPNTQGRMKWMFAVPVDDAGGKLVAAGKGEGAEIGLLDLETSAWQTLSEVAWVMSIISVDIDADGDLDILYTDRKGADRGVYVLPNRGNGALGSREYLGGTEAELMFMDVGDLVGDAFNEIAVATARKGILVLHQDSNQEWAGDTIPFPGEAGTGKAVAIGDLTGDGNPEIAVTTEHASGKHGVYYLKKKGTTWHAVDIGGLEGTKFDRIELLDLDGDGDLDLLTCEEAENLGVIWYENPASP